MSSRFIIRYLAASLSGVADEPDWMAEWHARQVFIGWPEIVWC